MLVSYIFPLFHLINFSPVFLYYILCIIWMCLTDSLPIWFTCLSLHSLCSGRDITGTSTVSGEINGSPPLTIKNSALSRLASELSYNKEDEATGRCCRQEKGTDRETRQMNVERQRDTDRDLHSWLFLFLLLLNFNISSSKTVFSLFSTNISAPLC